MRVDFEGFLWKVEGTSLPRHGQMDPQRDRQSLVDFGDNLQSPSTFRVSRVVEGRQRIEGRGPSPRCPGVHLRRGTGRG